MAWFQRKSQINKFPEILKYTWGFDVTLLWQIVIVEMLLVQLDTLLLFYSCVTKELLVVIDEDLSDYTS